MKWKINFQMNSCQIKKGSKILNWRLLRMATLWRPWGDPVANIDSELWIKCIWIIALKYSFWCGEWIRQGIAWQLFIYFWWSLWPLDLISTCEHTSPLITNSTKTYFKNWQISFSSNKFSLVNIPQLRELHSHPWLWDRNHVTPNTSPYSHSTDDL